MKCNPNFVGITVWKEGRSPGILDIGVEQDAHLLCKKQNVVKLEEGNYYTGNVNIWTGNRAKIVNESALKFSVKAGSINYLGNWVIDGEGVVSGMFNNVKVYTSVSNDSKISRQKFEKENPSIAPKYNWVNNLAHK